MDVLGALLEGFAAEQTDPVPAAGGQFTTGDHVRVAVKGSDSITGRVRRPHDAQPDSHVVIAPEGGGPHVVAKVGQVSLDTPERNARDAKQRAQDRERELAALPKGPAGLGPPAGKVAVKAPVVREASISLLLEDAPYPIGVGDRVWHSHADLSLGRGGTVEALGTDPADGVVTHSVAWDDGSRSSGVRSSTLRCLVEAFAAAPAGPALTQGETPAQSAARGKQQVTQAQAAVAAFNASKHPRGAGGKFSYSTGGKRATRSPASSSRVLTTGSNGALVKSLQRQLHIPADGIYGPQTKAAVERYQRQHGLQVDGVVGNQTLSALRGSPNAKSIKPGPITTRAATVKRHTTQRTTRVARTTHSTRRHALTKAQLQKKLGPWALAPAGRFGGGAVVR